MASSADCVACGDPLEMTVDSDSDDEQPQASSSSAPRQATVPDDLHLPCGCHFHWQCLLDQAVAVATTHTCPHCSARLSADPTQISAVYSSEGGANEPVNLLPVVVEEAHLQAHPEERPARALHTMAAENDVEGMVGLLRDADAERSALLAYRDPLAGMRTALHVAVEHARHDAFWLLLWAATALSEDAFGPEMRRTMAAIALDRPGADTAEDLRFVRDEQGRTPGDYAAAAGGEWENWINAGIFMP